jgi:hypothetical protein
MLNLAVSTNGVRRIWKSKSQIWWFSTYCYSKVLLQMWNMHIYIYIYIFHGFCAPWCLWSHARHIYTITSCFWLRCGVEQFQQILFLNMEIFRLFASFFHLLMIIGTNPKYSLLEDATRLSYIIIIITILIIIMVIICRRM